MALTAAQPAHADLIDFLDTANGVPTKLTNFGSGTITLKNGTATMYFKNVSGKVFGDFDFSWTGDENSYTSDGGPFFKYTLFNKTSIDFYQQKTANATLKGTGIPNNQLFTVKIQFSKDIPFVTYEPTEAAFPKPAPEPPGLASFLVALGGLGLIKLATRLRRVGNMRLKNFRSLPA